MNPESDIQLPEAFWRAIRRVDFHESVVQAMGERGVLNARHLGKSFSICFFHLQRRELFRGHAIEEEKYGVPVSVVACEACRIARMVTENWVALKREVFIV